ncbi:hypothetical protein GCM10009827_059300 [Dactylosporangium maewongense]|uniref:Uncharacterized protein n=1 Tax=Dactylosporangium maewongense TaxID=634393 RepID=A0ABP4LZZ0_9ACTN
MFFVWALWAAYACFRALQRVYAGHHTSVDIGRAAMLFVVLSVMVYGLVICFTA